MNQNCVYSNYVFFPIQCSRISLAAVLQHTKKVCCRSVAHWIYIDKYNTLSHTHSQTAADSSRLISVGWSTTPQSLTSRALYWQNDLCTLSKLLWSMPNRTLCVFVTVWICLRANEWVSKWICLQAYIRAHRFVQYMALHASSTVYVCVFLCVVSMWTVPNTLN